MIKWKLIIMDKDSIIKDCHIFLEGLSPNCGIAMIALISEVLSEGLEPARINLLASFIIAIGDSLTYIATRMDLESELAEDK